METNKSKLDLATRVALLYYNNNNSQQEIARTLGISRSYVSQLLAFAKDLGIVQIKINTGINYISEMHFTSKYGLKQVFSLTSSSRAFSDSEFGKFCAPHTLRLIRNVSNIGINLGASVQKVISKISKEDVGDSNVQTVVQIMGGCMPQDNDSSGTMPNELVFAMGRLLECKTLYLDCPAILSNSAAKSLLLQEQSIQNVLSAWNHLDLVLMGMGCAGEGMHSNNQIFTRDMLRNAGAVTDINLNYLDRFGNYLPLFEDHKMTLDFQRLSQVPTKVVYAYGVHKAPAILAALRAHMIDILFTDSMTLTEILRLDN